MSADLIQGKKGSGKSKLAVMWMREHLLAGRRVATNLDLNLEKLLPPMSKATAIRIPDKPTAFDLAALGSGNNGDRYNEEHDGLMVLDELALWLNARTFQDKERGPVMDYFVHSRKHGWGTAFICQDLVQVDKQVRESQVEYVTRCTRLDRVRIPMIGGIIALLCGDKAAELPKIHKATRRLGVDPRGMVARAYWYRDGGVQAGYDTLQIFCASYPHGAHSLLSPWHTIGRFLPPPVSLFQRLKLAALAFVGTSRRDAPTGAKLPIVASIMATLPPAERFRHVARLERLGLLRPGGDGDVRV
mgnify:CR=1 FL=1